MFWGYFQFGSIWTDHFQGDDLGLCLKVTHTHTHTDAHTRTHNHLGYSRNHVLDMSYPSVKKIQIIPRCNKCCWYSYLMLPNWVIYVGHMLGYPSPCAREWRPSEVLLDGYLSTKKTDFNKFQYGSVSKPCTPGEHQNSWDLWMFIPLKMYL